MNVDLIRRLVTERSGDAPMTHTPEELQEFAEMMLLNADIADYLRYCLPRELYIASGVRVGPLDRLVGERFCGPGEYIFPYGYLVVATSIGGNAVCLHAPSGTVWWADHTNFADEWIGYEDSESGELNELFEYTPENVAKACIPLSDSIEQFLIVLMGDELENQLEAID